MSSSAPVGPTAAAPARADEDDGSGLYLLRLGLCVALSVGAHFAFEQGLERLPARVDAALPQRLTVTLVAPPSEPPPPPTEPPPAPTAPPPPSAAPSAQAPQVATNTPRRPNARPEPPMPKDTPHLAPPTERPDPNANPDEEPVFGLSMESTSASGNGPGMPVGNTLAGTGGRRAPASQAPNPMVGGGGGEAAPAWEVTKMPLPQGRCAGRYTDAARAAGLEGTVVLDIVVGPDGRATDVRVVTGLGGGLNEAAIAAVRGCRFSPGERNGDAVSVRIRSFKVSFARREAE